MLLLYFLPMPYISADSYNLTIASFTPVGINKLATWTNMVAK